MFIGLMKIVFAQTYVGIFTRQVCCTYNDTNDLKQLRVAHRSFFYNRLKFGVLIKTVIFSILKR